MGKWILDIVNEILSTEVVKDAEQDFLFLKKQMMLRYKSRRYEYEESDMALLTLAFSIKWLREFEPEIYEGEKNG